MFTRLAGLPLDGATARPLRCERRRSPAVGGAGRFTRYVRAHHAHRRILMTTDVLLELTDDDIRTEWRDAAIRNEADTDAADTDADESDADADESDEAETEGDADTTDAADTDGTDA
jgi:hypothetical protein